MPAARHVLTILAFLGALLCAAAPATAGTRATLTWDTADTDIDLHVWDRYGSHAYYLQQEDIYGAELSTDITNGFGPELLTESFEAQDAESYYYGVCYYASHWDDDTVPATTITLTLTDPDGTQRTVKRVLRERKESFLLGASPVGSTDAPTEDFCGDRSARPESDPGDQTPSEPIASAACSATTQRLGSVVICADASAGSGTRYTLRGNVRVNGGVGLGDGPIEVDTASRLIWSDAAAPISVRRTDGTTVAVGSAPISIDADPVTDPRSGRSGLAKVVLGGFVPGLMKISGFNALVGVGSLTGPAKLEGYLDPREGGGVILAAQLELPLGGAKSESSFSIGVHRGARSAVRVLSGSADFSSVKLPGSPWTGALKLGYREDGDLWDASGGISTPVLGLDVEGQLQGGQINAVGVTVKRDVLLGQTGIVISKLGGKVEGLVTPPVKVTASIGARWPSVPGVPAGILVLDDASMSFATDLSASFRGRYSLGYAGSPVGGELKLDGRLDPFRISGSLENRIAVAGVSVSGGYGAELTPSTFRATGEVKGTLLGAKVGGATAGLSEQGLGVVGSMCFPGFDGFRFNACKTRQAIGASMRWDKFGHLAYGGDALRQIGIKSAARLQAGATAVTVRAKGDEPVLVWQFTGIDPALRVVGPGGRAGGDGCRAGKSTRVCEVIADPATNVTTVVVFDPAAGRWSVVGSGGGPQLTDPTVESVRSIRKVGRPTFAKGGSRKHPLKRTTQKVEVRWGATAGAGKRVRVDVYVSTVKGAPGTLVSTDRKPAGSVGIPRTAFPAGGAYVRLVSKVDGIPAGEVWTKKAIWIAP